MKFKVDWKVVESSDRGSLPIAAGSVEKEGESAQAVQTELETVLKKIYPDTAHTDREYSIVVTPL